MALIILFRLCLLGSCKTDGAVRLGNQPSEISPADVGRIQNEVLASRTCRGEVACHDRPCPIRGSAVGWTPRRLD